jgi:hypothetical protein
MFTPSIGGVLAFTVTVVCFVCSTPAEFVTVKVYSVVTSGETLNALPLTATSFPGLMDPFPLVNTAVRSVDSPGKIVAGLPAKLVIDGGGAAVMSTRSVFVAVAPAEFVTFSVYVVVDRGVTVTGRPLVTARLPGETMPLPWAKTAVSLMDWPAFTFAALATKLEIDGLLAAGTEIERGSCAVAAR